MKLETFYRAAEIKAQIDELDHVIAIGEENKALHAEAVKASNAEGGLPLDQYIHGQDINGLEIRFRNWGRLGLQMIDPAYQAIAQNIILAGMYSMRNKLQREFESL